MTSRRKFLAVVGAGAAALAAAVTRPGWAHHRPGHPPNKPTTTAAATTTTLPATTTTGAMPTTTSVTIGTSPRPLPGPEPFPAANYPPGTTVQLDGAQTSQYRPNALSNRIFDLGDATWATSPVGGPRWPIVVDDGGGGTPNGTNTVLLGATINGNIDQDLYRGDNYDAYDGAIEHNSNSTSGYIIGDTVRVHNHFDGYRLQGSGVGYLKRCYFTQLSDDGVEIENLGGGTATAGQPLSVDQDGDVYIYDSYIECIAGISDRDGPGVRHNAKLVIDGLLMWLRPVKDQQNSSTQFQGCSGTAGCGELSTSGKFTYGIWKGEEASRGTIVVRNSWFRIDRYSCYEDDAMAWPGGEADPGWGGLGGAPTSYTYGPNVKVLWTGLDLSGNPTSAPYPGPDLPSGVELVTGPTALSMWNAAAADWKADHGY